MQGLNLKTKQFNLVEKCSYLMEMDFLLCSISFMELKLQMSYSVQMKVILSRASVKGECRDCGWGHMYRLAAIVQYAALKKANPGFCWGTKGQQRGDEPPICPQAWMLKRLWAFQCAWWLQGEGGRSSLVLWSPLSSAGQWATHWTLQRAV